MEAEALAVCAALYTGFAWGAGALSTWLAVKPMRKRLEALDAWREKACEFGLEAGEETTLWARKVAVALRTQADVLEVQADMLNAHQAQLQGFREEVEGLRRAVLLLGGSVPDEKEAPGAGREEVN